MFRPDDQDPLNDPVMRLAALEAHLKAHGFTTESTADGLVVRNPYQARLADTVTCRPHPGDSMRLWFFTSGQGPIAEAERITDAVVGIKGFLKARM